jgi:hypothetical protein
VIQRRETLADLTARDGLVREGAYR